MIASRAEKRFAGRNGGRASAFGAFAKGDGVAPLGLRPVPAGRLDAATRSAVAAGLTRSGAKRRDDAPGEVGDLALDGDGAADFCCSITITSTSSFVSERSAGKRRDVMEDWKRAPPGADIGERERRGTQSNSFLRTASLTAETAPA